MKSIVKRCLTWNEVLRKDIMALIIAIIVIRAINYLASFNPVSIYFMKEILMIASKR